MGKSDEQLVKDFLEGNELAFEELLENNLKQVLNFIYRFTADKGIAEDLTQVTFLKAWKNIKRFDSKKKFKTWLFTIAKNTAYDWLKSKKDSTFSAFEEGKEEGIFENIPDERLLPDEILERKDLADELDQKLKAIPEKYRLVLLLHYREDFTLHEIAEILDESYNTIKSRHRRALLELKKSFTA